MAIPSGREDIQNFISVIVNPVRFKGVDIKDDEATITASTQSKAALIGRNKVRLEEMQNILNQYFGIKKLLIR